MFRDIAVVDDEIARTATSRHWSTFELVMLVISAGAFVVVDWGNSRSIAFSLIMCFIGGAGIHGLHFADVLAEAKWPHRFFVAARAVMILGFFAFSWTHWLKFMTPDGVELYAGFRVEYLFAFMPEALSLSGLVANTVATAKLKDLREERARILDAQRSADPVPLPTERARSSADAGSVDGAGSAISSEPPQPKLGSAPPVVKSPSTEVDVDGSGSTPNKFGDLVEGLRQAGVDFSALTAKVGPNEYELPAGDLCDLVDGLDRNNQADKRYVNRNRAKLAGLPPVGADLRVVSG